MKMSDPSITHFQGDNYFLSNFWGCSVEMDGVVYSSVEHAYQAAKTNNLQERERIQKAPTPGEAKRRGRSVTLREDWESVKLPVMKQLVINKFRNVELAARLKATGGAELIEGNWWGDTFWGICKGEGENHLGYILMEVRLELFLS